MSHTKRKLLANRYFRRPSTLNTKRMELAANEALLDEGFNPANRQQARANPGCEALPTSWDDIYISALGEAKHAHLS